MAAFTREELKQLAIEQIPVVVNYRSSTEICEGVGVITEINEVYKGGKTHEVVTVSDLRANSIMRVRPEDVLRIAEDALIPKGARQEGEKPLEYVMLGRVGGSDEFRLMAYRGGAKAALYKGYMDESREVMRLYIKEPYMRGVPAKDEIALRLLRRDCQGQLGRA